MSRKRIKLKLNDRIFRSINEAHRSTQHTYQDAARKAKVIFVIRVFYQATIKGKMKVRKGCIEWGHSPSIEKPHWIDGD